MVVRPWIRYGNSKKKERTLLLVQRGSLLALFFSSGSDMEMASLCIKLELTTENEKETESLEEWLQSWQDCVSLFWKRYTLEIVIFRLNLWVLQSRQDTIQPNSYVAIFLVFV